MEKDNMSWNSSNVIPKIKVENAIQELLNKFNNLSLRDPKTIFYLKIYLVKIVIKIKP